MARTWRLPDTDALICPDCQGDLSFVSAWSFRGSWGYNEVRTYECPTHGPIFISPQVSVGHRPTQGLDTSQDDGDRDSLISAPRKPTPLLDADTIAIPEPDSD